VPPPAYDDLLHNLLMAIIYYVNVKVFN